MRNCQVCIGTLALHRKNMTEASPLKTREYLAHGFPVIIGYKDTAFYNQNQIMFVKLILAMRILQIQRQKLLGISFTRMLIE